MAIELVHVAADLEAVVPRQARRVDARAGDDDHPQVGHPLLRLREGVDHPPEQVPADARASNGDDADPLVVAVTERTPVPESARVEPVT